MADSLSIHITQPTRSNPPAKPSKRLSASTPASKSKPNKRHKLSDDAKLEENLCDAPSLRHLFSFGQEVPAPPAQQSQSQSQYTTAPHPTLVNASTLVSTPVRSQLSTPAAHEQSSGTPYDEYQHPHEDLYHSHQHHPPTSIAFRLYDDDESHPHGHLHYDPYDDEAVTHAAHRFFRQTDIIDLEAQFSAEDGIRSQMKRDFRLKRANAKRGRKLGSAPTT